MKRIEFLSLITLSLLAIGSLSAVADGDDDRDHEIALKAMSEGRIRPLMEIMDQLKAQIPGQIVGVELEAKEKDRFIYEFKVLTSDGELKEVKVDAVTGKIVKIEGDD